MRVRGLAAIAVVLLLLVGAVVNGATAEDAKGCEGLSDYRAAMFKAGRDYLDSRGKDGIETGRDPFTYSSDDWTKIADHALAYQKALKDIDPPEWAAPWHQAQIESIGLLEQMSRAVAEDGIFAVIAFEKQINDADAKRSEALEAVTKTCADFAQFQRDWDALDGENEQGTPVATPTD